MTRWSDYASRREDLERQREALAAQRIAIEKKIALRNATLQEHCTISYNNCKSRLKRMRAARVDAERRNSEFLCFLKKAQEKAEKAAVQQKYGLSSASKHLQQEKCRYQQRIEAMYPIWKDQVQEYKLQKLRELEQRTQTIEQRRVLAQKTFVKEQQLEEQIRRLSDQLGQQRNMENTEIMERQLVRDEKRSSQLSTDGRYVLNDAHLAEPRSPQLPLSSSRIECLDSEELGLDEGCSENAIRPAAVTQSVSVEAKHSDHHATKGDIDVQSQSKIAKDNLIHTSSIELSEESKFDSATTELAIHNGSTKATSADSGTELCMLNSDSSVATINLDKKAEKETTIDFDQSHDNPPQQASTLCESDKSLQTHTVRTSSRVLSKPETTWDLPQDVKNTLLDGLKPPYSIVERVHVHAPENSSSGSRNGDGTKSGSLALDTPSSGSKDEKKSSKSIISAQQQPHSIVIQKMSDPDQLKVLNILCQRVKEGIAELEPVESPAHIDKDPPRSTEIIRLALTNCKSQVAFHSADVCLSVILEILHRRGRDLIPAAIFSVPNNHESLRGFHQKNDPMSNVWDLLVDLMQKLTLYKPKSANVIINDFVAVISHDSQIDAEAVRKLREYIEKMCTSSKEKELSEAPPNRIVKPASPTKSTLIVSTSPLLLQSSQQKHPETPQDSSSKALGKSPSDSILRNLSLQTSFSQKLLRGMKLTDYSDDEDDLDTHELTAAIRLEPQICNVASDLRREAVRLSESLEEDDAFDTDF